MSLDKPISQLPTNPLAALTDLIAISKGSLNTYKTPISEYLAMAGAANISTYPAGEIIPSQRVVVMIGGELFKFDPTNAAHYKKVIGVTKQAAIVIGQMTDVFTSGNATGFGGTLTQDTVYYGGMAGALADTPPVNPDEFVIFVGFAIDANTLFVQLDDNFQLA